MAVAWIIEWSLHRRDLPIRDLRPHILPRQWWSDRVLDYMRCMFWNSALWTPFESLARVNKRKPQGIFILNEGPRLIYGDATHLIAWYVKDLLIERDRSGKVVMEWTAPPGTHFDGTRLRFDPLGSPRKRRFAWSE
jgi:hypothetical protein